ncbi:MAG: nucleotidyltransferase domain-containing protein, partial [Candidatus Eisenbacteria bacterium]
MLGGIVGQRKSPLRLIEREVLPAAPEAAGADRAFADAARAYFLLGALHEESLARFGKSPLYPEGVADLGPKFWHFYAAALVASRLGNASWRTARLIGLAIGAGYEAVTYPKNLRQFSYRGALRPWWWNAVDAARDIVAHDRGTRFGWLLANSGSSPAADARISDGIRALVSRIRETWWEVGPRLLSKWRAYQDALTSDGVIEPRRALQFFMDVKTLGWSGRILGDWSTDTPAVVAEARELFSRYFPADPAVDRFLSRAALAYGGSGTQLRKNLVKALRQASTLPPARWAAFLDSQIAESELERIRAFRRVEQPEVLKQFKALALADITKFNEGAPRDGRIAGIVLLGSYARGTARPGSDLDVIALVEGGARGRARELFKSLSEHWARLRPDVPLAPYSPSEAPATAAGLESLRKMRQGAILILSPYPQIPGRIGDPGASAPAPPHPGAFDRAVKRLARSVLASGLAVADTFAVVGQRLYDRFGRTPPLDKLFYHGYRLLGGAQRERAALERLHRASPLPNLGEVDETLLRGAQPSEEGFRLLRSRGVELVINLRASDGGEREVVEALGMTYLHLPISGVPSAEQVARFFATIDAAPGRVFIHCTRGMNRTSMMSGLEALRRGRPLEDVLRDARRFGFDPGLARAAAQVRFLEERAR